MGAQDIRWQQRFSNFKKALEQLNDAVALAQDRPLTTLERQGLIHGFENTYELGWNTLKDFLQHQGNQSIYGSRDATREAFRIGLIDDGEGWMEMLIDRNLTSHTYNTDMAETIATHITAQHFQLFLGLRDKLESLVNA